MHVAFAQQLIYLLIAIVGTLLFYQMIVGGILTSYAQLSSTVAVTSDTLLYTMMDLVNTTQQNAKMVTHTSLVTLHSITNTLHMIRRTIVQLITILTTRFYGLVSTLTTRLIRIQFHFRIVIQQTYNATSNMFAALQEKVSGVTRFVAQFQTFFAPPQPTLLQYASIGLLVLGVICIVALTIYSRSKGQLATIDLSESIPPQEGQMLPRNPVRRKAKLT